MEKIEDIIIFPEYRSGFGTGHMKRCVSLVKQIEGSKLFIPQTYVDFWQSFVSDIPVVNNMEKASLCIIDSPQIDESFLSHITVKAELIGIDSIGPHTKIFDYIIDTLPRLENNASFMKPNYSSRNLLDLPARIKDGQEIKKVLVNFGGEDSYQLSYEIFQKQFLKELFPNAELTLVIGAKYAGPRPQGVKILEAVPKLTDILGDFDAFVGQFGLGAYEALALGLSVFLYNPTDYHDKLSEIEGFIILPNKSKSLKENPNSYLNRSINKTKTFSHKKESLGDLIKTLPHKLWSCPACRSGNIEVLDRFPERSFGKCLDCEMTSMRLYKNQEIAYSEEYFFEAYKEQYGKTYLEDFDHIYKLGLTRLKKIHAYSKANMKLIDIGCAYGPFIKAAQDQGHRVMGIDISQSAVNYCKEKLGIDARVFDLFSEKPEDLYKDEKFDCVTMWYVIEHFENLAHVLEFIHTILKPGGIFALATPSISGVTGLSRRHEFFEQSPMDHYTLWNPRRLKKLLKLHGFKLKTWYGLSHHPKRFPGFLSWKVFSPLLKLLSKIFRLSDTFEAILIKEEDIR